MLLTYLGVLVGSILSCGILVRAFQREVAYIENRAFGARLSELSDWRKIRKLRIANAGPSFGVEFMRHFSDIALETTLICCTRFPVFIFQELDGPGRYYPSICSKAPLIGIGPSAQNLDDRSLIGLIACKLARHSRQYTLSELVFYFTSWRSNRAEWAADALAASRVGWKPVVAYLEHLHAVAEKESRAKTSRKIGTRLFLLRRTAKTR